MKFYTGDFKYDEIYFDEKSRLITFARKLHEMSWGKRWEGCYLAFTKCTLTCIVYAVAVTDNKISIKDIRKYIQAMINDLEDESGVELTKIRDTKFFLKEVTLNSFMETIKDDGYENLYDDKCAMLNELCLKEESKICPEYLLDDDFWDRNNEKYISELIDIKEIHRIKEGRRSICEEKWVQPVHYLIREQDVKLSESIAQEIIFYLCAWNRISSRRIVKLESLNRYDKISGRKIANLNTLEDGIVIIRQTNDDSEEDFIKLLDEVYGESKYAVIIIWNKDSSAEEILKRHSPQWTFILVQNKKMNRTEAIGYFKKLIKSEGLTVESSTWKKIFNVKNEYAKKEINDMFHSWLCYTYNIEHFFPQYADTVLKYHNPAVTDNAAHNEMEELIGLDTVKKMLQNITSFYKVQKTRYKKNPNIKNPTMHMVFYGNPGTAKTTVARLLGRIFATEGILSKGDFYEVGRADLVGQYVGWTAKEVQKYFNKAKGSILFIDEAYSLVEEHDSFGKEAIDTIVQEMENHRNDVVVIMAGYPNDIQKLLDKNQGLRSRIAFFIEFPDYNDEELYAILEKLVKDEGMLLDDDVKKVFLDTLAQYNTSKGNGRIVRNILDSAKIKQAGRISRLPKKQLMSEMMLLKGCDFI